MTPWPTGWKRSARLASISCECCGRKDQRPVPDSLGVGKDTGLLCASPRCPFCTGWCRATFLVLDYAQEETPWGSPQAGDSGSRSGLAAVGGQGVSGPLEEGAQAGGGAFPGVGGHGGLASG